MDWRGSRSRRAFGNARPAQARFREYFSGYQEEPEQVLRKTFTEVDGYDEMVVLRGVTFESHCEHHIAPIIGRVWVGYIPDRRVVGISKLAREIQGALQIPKSTLAHHIAQLVSAGLMTQRREGRVQRCRVDVERSRHLLKFLIADCCEGLPDLAELLRAAQ